MANYRISQEMKQFIVSFLKKQSFVNGDNERVNSIKQTINALNIHIQEFKNKLNGLKTVKESGLLSSTQLEELQSKVMKETKPLAEYQAKLTQLENELRKIDNSNKPKYRLMDSNLRNSYMTPDGSPAWLIKQGFLGLLSAIENFDVLDSQFENVDSDSLELGIKAAITHHFTERSSKSGRAKYTSRFHLEDSTNAVKESMDHRLNEILNLLQ